MVAGRGGGVSIGALDMQPEFSVLLLAGRLLPACRSYAMIFVVAVEVMTKASSLTFLPVCCKALETIVLKLASQRTSCMRHSHSEAL